MLTAHNSHLGAMNDLQTGSSQILDRVPLSNSRQRRESPVNVQGGRAENLLGDGKHIGFYQAGEAATRRS
ncbi:hypothetical protein D3C84_1217840 [compost metagenome]